MEGADVMKKGRFIGCGIGILFCVLIFLVFKPIILRYSSVFRYQNTGKISLEIDGNETTLNNVGITFSIDDDLVGKGKIKNGKFKFWRGNYGANICKFKIPAELYEGQTDIFFEVRYFSGNCWEINDFNINLSITTDDGIKVYADGFVKIEGDRELYNFEALSKEITEKDNIINLYASGI